MGIPLASVRAGAVRAVGAWVSSGAGRLPIGIPVASVGAGAAGPTLAERLGREVWIDFVADTGDDRDLSRAVARMLFAEYALEGPGGRVGGLQHRTDLVAHGEGVFFF